MQDKELNYSQDPLVGIYRSGELESLHYGHALLFDGQKIKTFAGNKDFQTYTRSTIKPIQAKVSKNILEEELSEDLLAIACASHMAEHKQLEAVKRLKQKFNLDEKNLACGCSSHSRGSLKSKIEHNCSGKQMAMLAACKKQGYSLNDFHHPEHPLQLQIKEEIVRLLKASFDFKIGVDGCLLPNYFMSLEAMLKLFYNMLSDNSYQEIIMAMNKHAELIHGEKYFDSILMTNYRNKFLSKTGAEGLQLVINLISKEVLLVKIQDGSNRAKAIATKGLLARLNWIDSLDLDEKLYASNSKVIGEIKSFF